MLGKYYGAMKDLCDRNIRKEMMESERIYPGLLLRYVIINMLLRKRILMYKPQVAPYLYKHASSMFNIRL